ETWKGRRGDRLARSHTLGRHDRRPSERVKVDAGESTLMQAFAALDEQRAGAGTVAVGEVLVADRDLDEPLQRLARVALRGHPVGLEHLVNLEVKPGVEEQAGRLQGLVEIGLRGQYRSIGQRAGRTAGALPDRGRQLILLGREPAARRRIVGRQRAQLAARVLVAQRGDDRARQTIAHTQRQRRQHASYGVDVGGGGSTDLAGGATGVSGESTSVAGGSSGWTGAGRWTRRTSGRGGMRRSTRLPAMRSCRARLSRRRPAIRYPNPTMA